MQFFLTHDELFILDKVAKVSQKLGVRSFIVGGFVRDRLLNRSCKDIDIVCLGDAIALAEEVSLQFQPQPKLSWFKTFGTAHFHSHGYDVEFVGARKESYRKDSRNPEVEPGSLQDDQERRDFTINALAIEISALPVDFLKNASAIQHDFSDSIIDPFNGLEDLQQGVIRTPMSPDKTFSDDPLRMLRAIRFATQLNFRIETNTFLGIADTADRISIITQERITDEFNKVMMTNKPSVGLDLLYKSGLLKIIFPQLVDLAGAEYIDGKGHKDNFYHTLQVLDNICPNTDNLWLRWAALLHDIAKPATKRFENGVGWTFHGHEVVEGEWFPRSSTNGNCRFMKS